MFLFLIASSIKMKIKSWSAVSYFWIDGVRCITLCGSGLYNVCIKPFGWSVLKKQTVVAVSHCCLAVPSYLWAAWLKSHREMSYYCGGDILPSVRLKALWQPACVVSFRSRGSTSSVLLFPRQLISFGEVFDLLLHLGFCVWFVTSSSYFCFFYCRFERFCRESFSLWSHKHECILSVVWPQNTRYIYMMLEKETSLQ